MPTILPIKELKNTAEIVRTCNSAKEPIFITKNGYGELVVMSMEYYQTAFAKQQIADMISVAHNDVLNGNTIDGKEFFDKMGEKYEK